MQSILSKNIVRIAAAGAGKTYTICREAEKEISHYRRDLKCNKRVLMISYATKAVDSIDEELRKENSGVIPTGIDVQSWYSFVLNEMIKPYQTEIFGINEIKGLFFDHHSSSYNRFKIGNRNRYITKGHDLKSEETAELAMTLNAWSKEAVFKRLEEIYGHIFIDEVQDMAGWDLNIISRLMQTQIKITVVGDGKQAVFKTNYAQKNKGKGGVNVWEYFQNLQRGGLANIERQNVSRRFNYEICNFANRVYSNDNNIRTSMNEITGHDGVFFIMQHDVKAYVDYFSPQVLRWNKNSNTDGFDALNFGECKGQTFDRVLIYPNGPLENFLFKNQPLKSPVKYYVAVTRPKYSIAFVINKVPENKELEKVKIGLGNTDIIGWHLLPDKKFDIEK